jgi:hypothetical protein
VPDQLDHEFKRRIWKRLLEHGEVILKTENETLYSAERRANVVDGAAAIPNDKSIQDLDWLLSNYDDSLYLLASENKQWISVTGLPKNGNPVIISNLNVLAHLIGPKLTFQIIIMHLSGSWRGSDTSRSCEAYKTGSSELSWQNKAPRRAWLAVVLSSLHLSLF